MSKEIKVENKTKSRWISWEDKFGTRVHLNSQVNKLGVFCSACGNHADNSYNYCPTCGAKMDLEEVKEVYRPLFSGFHQGKHGIQKIFINGEWISGKWVIGDFLGDSTIIPEGQEFEITGNHIRAVNLEAYDVIPETVSQYIGIKDIGNNSLFEKDIVSFNGEYYVVRKECDSLDGEPHEVGPVLCSVNSYYCNLLFNF